VPVDDAGIAGGAGPGGLARLVAQFREQQAEAKRLDEAIAANLALIGYLQREEERNDRSN